MRTPVFPLFDGHIQLTHITKKYDQTLGSDKNRYTVVSFFGLLIKVTSYNNRVLTVDRQAKFTQDKCCWVKVNENMRNHLIKGLAASLITMKSHGDFHRHTLCRAGELSFLATEGAMCGDQVSRSPFSCGKLVQISSLSWGGIISITGV